MIAEIISIGDELTSGQRLDTNSQWLSQQLGELGVDVRYHSTVADDLEANVSVFQIALNRANIILVTGGLGPTEDDLTRSSLATALGVGLYRDESSLEHIRELFARRNRPMPDRNQVQADFPVGSIPILNPHGSAPGILWKDNDADHPRILMAFPGVPAELKEMYGQTALPAICEFLGSGRQFLVHKPIRCFGLGESDIEARLPEMIKRGRDPQVGITASAATITLRISARGNSEDECQQKINETESTIRESLGDLVFGTGEEELQHVVLNSLRDSSQTLALVEVGTGGYLSHLISSVDDRAEVFQGSYVTRDNDRISQFLGTPSPSEPIDISETAKLLAERCRAVFATDFAIAIDAFPDNESDLLRIAVATPDKTIKVDKPFGGHPSILLPRAAKQAMDVLRHWLLNEQRKTVSSS